MRVAWVLLLLGSSAVLPPLLLAGDSGGRAHYVGGTAADLPGKTEGNLIVTDEQVLHFRHGRGSVRIPFRSINTLEYGQQVSRRVAEAILVSPLMLLVKKRRHYLTVGYVDSGGQQQALVFQVNKNAVRVVLAGLEARTGLRVEYQDEEARKAGRG
ncbi:MAG: hypothetical protein IPM24_00275 [Bryobacterales bacterium]|nr:hypothetical protein [Bryobacterales bacterium]